MTLFHRPKKTGVPRGLRRAGEVIELAEREDLELIEAVTVIAGRHHFDSQQTRALLKLATERKAKESE